MTNGFRISSAFFRKLEELNISPQSVLRRAGLPAAVLGQEKVLVTTPEFFAIYRAISESSADPETGLKLGSEERLERYDPIAIAALCTRNFRDALARLARYKQLTCPEKIEINEDRGECSVRFLWLLSAEQEPALLSDVCLAWVVAIGRRGTAGLLHPKRVEFARPAHGRELYEAHFHCPVKFDAPHNLLVFRQEDLERPFDTHNADLLALVAPQLEEELKKQRTGRTLAEQVTGILKSMFAGQRPTLELVARELRLSTRTLQRRLTAQHLTFQDLVKEARRELAQHYLLHSRLELNETAYLLGYEDANSFFRAFHDWEGTSPGEWRATRTLPAT